jgi:hypothetical protein
MENKLEETKTVEKPKQTRKKTVKNPDAPKIYSFI